MPEDQVFDFAFTYFASMDEANAALHCAPVRYSPITFRLADVLTAHGNAYGWRTTDQVQRVMSHRSSYPEDTGR